MKKLAMVVVLFCLLALPIYSVAEEYTIIGYAPEEFAVKGTIEQQAKRMVESWGTKKPAKIIIQGFADKTGKAAENDKVARDRAGEMKAFLEIKTDAKITALSRGDSKDAREVVVVAEFAAAAPIALAKKSSVNEGINLLGFCLAVATFVSLLSLIIWLFIRMKRKAKGTVGDSGIHQAPPTVLRETPIEVTFKSQRYFFWPEITPDKKLYKTFHEIEPGEVMMLRFNRKYKDSIVGSLKQISGLYEELTKAKRLVAIV
ncbi:MAG: hypothetical protein Q8O59_04640 [bacterium]|nr:hypothetical protein [bacterium]